MSLSYKALGEKYIIPLIFSIHRSQLHTNLKLQEPLDNHVKLIHILSPRVTIYYVKLVQTC